MNSKLFLGGLLFMYGLGSLTNWFLSRLDWNQPQAIATETKSEPKGEPKTVNLADVKPVKNAREMLEQKYRLCVGNPDGDLSKVPDTVMNQVIKKTCMEKS